jgi:hypothetical protein
VGSTLTMAFCHFTCVRIPSCTCTMQASEVRWRTAARKYHGSTAKNSDARSAQGSQKPAEHSQYIHPTNKVQQTTASVPKRNRLSQADTQIDRHLFSCKAIMKKRELEHVTQKATPFASSTHLPLARLTTMTRLVPPTYMLHMHGHVGRILSKTGNSFNFLLSHGSATHQPLPLLKTARNQSTKLRIQRTLTAAPAAYRICHRAVQIPPSFPSHTVRVGCVRLPRFLRLPPIDGAWESSRSRICWVRDGGR